VSLKLPLAPGAYDKGDQAQMRGAVERADLQNRKRQEDLVLGPGQRLVFYDGHGAEQHFTGAILGGLVRSDMGAQGLSPAEQANARANIATGSGAGAAGGSSGQVQFNSGGAMGGLTVGGDASLNVLTGALTLAAVNADAGLYGDAAHVGQFSVNAKGLVTAASSVPIAFPVTAFNARTGAVTLTSADVGGALGYTPGTVASVGLSAPPIFTVTGSPVTTTGALSLALAAQGANTVLAGPASGAATAPAFRALASADLPVGSASQLGAVKVDGTTITASGGVISAVGGGGGGGLVLLEQHTASNSSSLNFASWYSAVYDEYVVEFINIVPAVGDDFYMQWSADGGVTYSSSGYSTAYGYAYSGGIGGSGANVGGYRLGGSISTNPTYGGLNGSFKIYNPGSSSAYKHVNGQMSDYDTNASYVLYYYFAGLWTSVSPVNAFRIIKQGGSNITSGAVRIYGISH